ncbi:MAG: mechanosensitive ion channel domain-containing protein [Aminivibrio sp.]
MAKTRRGLFTGRPVLFIFLLVLFYLMAASPCFSAETEQSSPEEQKKEAPAAAGKEERMPPPDKEEIKGRIEEIQKEMDLYLKRREEIQGDDGDESELIRKVTVALGSVQNVYSRYNAALENLEQARKEASEAAELDEKSLVQESPPYNLTFYEGVRNQYEGVDQRLKSVASSIQLAESSLESLPKTISALESKLGDLRAELMTPEGKTPDVEYRMRETEAELEAAQVSLHLHKTSLEANRLRRSFLETRKKLLEKDIEGVKNNLYYDEADRNGKIEDLGQQIVSTRESIASLRAEREKLRNSLAKAQGELNAARSDQQKMTAQAGVAEFEAWLKHNQAALDQAEQELTVLDESARIWEIRYELIRDSLPGKEIWDYRSNAGDRIKDLENIFRVQHRNIAAIQAEIQAARKAREDAGGNSAASSRIAKQIDALEKTIQITNSSITRLLELFNKYNRFQAELNSEIDAVRIAEQVTRFGKDRFLAFWNTPLWTGDDFEVTIAKLTLAVVLFGAAFFLSGRLTAFLGRTLLKRLGMDSSARTATQQILFYIFMVSFILSALDMVGIPLTAFAFLGGAVAIGIGFGAQNFFNNLISGFILMFSKPIRPNDTIEIDGMFASVEEIGSRSTRAKTFDNIDVLIPNNYFLDNKIVNWSLMDQKIRLKIDVGVAYGSDVRKVERLLLKAAEDHSRVLKKPDPFVIFRNFGPDALEFTLYAWIDMSNASTMKVGSDLRFRLISLFEDNQISIAMPRMNINLNGAEPIDVIMRRPAPEEKEEPAEEVE